MKPALLLVDLQLDFLRRPALTPRAEEIVERASSLLRGFRTLGVPVLHAHTIIHSDGRNRMPHWQEKNIWSCLQGTEGSQPPESLAPLGNESVFQKSFYSAFEDPALSDTLSRHGIDTLIICGLYLHACIRSTVLDGYRHGYRIWVASDAIASPDPVHAEITRSFLEQRAAHFLNSAQILTVLGAANPSLIVDNARKFPVCWINDNWVEPTQHALWRQPNPANHDQVLGCVPIAEPHEIEQAIQQAVKAQRIWRTSSIESRQFLLSGWADRVAAQEDEFVNLLATEIGKPVTEGRAEIRRAVAHIRTASSLLLDTCTDTKPTGSASTRLCPRGVIAIITPWNNPVSIAAGKLAPALAFGNGVIWKPALQAPRTTMALMESLVDAGLPDGLIAVLFGDASVAHRAIVHPLVHAVSITGSTDTGRYVAALCAQHLKPLQAELGGNNAAVIMDARDQTDLARRLAYSAFGFGGQRCTATRRFIVDASIAQDFTRALANATRELRLGDPNDPITQIGPLISRSQQEKTAATVREALDSGAELVCGGSVPTDWVHGCWFEPTLLTATDPLSHVVQDETFGPVAIIQTARGIEEAMSLCNGVAHGLVASLYSENETVQASFLDEVEAGIVRINPGIFEIDAEAPFGGWKHSSLGPPEHGRWDAEFYSRPQALYGLPVKKGGKR